MLKCLSGPIKKSGPENYFEFTRFACNLFSGYTPEMLIRTNKTISVFRVTSLKILGRIGTHFFFNYFLFWKKI